MQYQSNMYPSLTKSYKNCYPFKIGTTSFIYPDLYVPNVNMLGPFVDEIELLLFESGPVERLLSVAVIEDLQRLSQALQVSYNIHLPTDISITDPAGGGQERAAETFVRIIERMAVLSPTGYTLHVPYPGAGEFKDRLQKWPELVCRNLEKIIQSGVPADQIAIETLDYPIDLLAPIIDELKLAVCMDMGHLFLYGYDVTDFFERYGKNVSIVHLHGVFNNRDHLSLETLPADLMRTVVNVLQNFSGTVSIEVFSFVALASSLLCLEDCWQATQSAAKSPG